MIIKADEDSMSRMLDVPVGQIPESILAEYQLRLKWFHCDGNSGAMGTVAIIDMLRSLGCKPKPREKQETMVDWSRVPTDGSVRVMARVPDGGGGQKWASGVYQGSVGIGSALAILLDGETWARELRRVDVRIARDEPMEPSTPKAAPSSDIPEPWASVETGHPVMVEEDDDYKDGKYQGMEAGEVLVTLDGDLTSRPFALELVTCLETEEAK